MKLAILWISLLSATTAFAEDKVSKYAEVYVDDHITVTVVRYGDKSDNTKLIRFSGIDGEHDGKVYLHTCKSASNENENNVKCCSTEITGENYCSLVKSGNSWGSSYKVYIPGYKSGGADVWSASAKNVDTKDVLNQYLVQQVQ